MRQLPIRDRNRILESNSLLFFRNNIPENWTTTVPDADYGVDLIVNIFDGRHPAYDFEVQLKASEKLIEGDFENARLKISTYNYLVGRLHVIMLIKYNEEEKEAYWTFLSKVPKPNQDSTTFTVKIPKTNKLSNIDWDSVHSYIKEIMDYKLCAGEEFRNKIKQK
jgi:hypothetical protein